jgi:hypothetical protein
MKSLARYPSNSGSRSNHPCPDLATMAERELSAFVTAIKRLFGSEQANLSAEDWLQELMVIDTVPASAREWRSLTTKAATRLACRVSSSTLFSSLSTESLSTESLFIEQQIA